MKTGRKLILSSIFVLLLLVGVMGGAWADGTTYTVPEGWIVPDTSITPSTVRSSSVESEPAKSLTVVTEEPAIHEESVEETTVYANSWGGTATVSYNISDDGVSVTLVSTKAISGVRDFTLGGPNRDVFDLTGVSTDNEPANIFIGNNLLSQIRFGASPEDGLFRMVFDMGSTGSTYSYSLSEDRTTLTITLTPISSASASVSTTSDPPS
ncbi:MAG: AMIN domain-containing protein [Clostridia bacterium]|nr:AMIN domain-containing protein [Clostridia bacterium]